MFAPVRLLESADMTVNFTKRDLSKRNKQ